MPKARFTGTGRETPHLWPWKKTVPAPAEPGRGFPTEIAEADCHTAYVNGLLQGELHGRLALAREIEAQFSPNTTREFNADEAKTLRLRQVH